MSTAYFQDFVNKNWAEGKLTVQPRMGFSDNIAMRKGLQSVKDLPIPSIGTITIDSFTRTGDLGSAKKALLKKEKLNGYPLVSQGTKNNKILLAGIIGPDFPVQVRHGSPVPQRIFEASIDAGISAIEGGPISYCLPYGRIPLSKSLVTWREACKTFADAWADSGHIESFGGCMMGQMCPPSMLIAVTIIEVLFFAGNGIRSFSVSLTQGTSSLQDIAALRVLRRLGIKYIPASCDWHIVFYNFMGKFPETSEGARSLIREGARIARIGNAQRLVVKTVKEAHGIPSITDNLDALQWAYSASQFKSGSYPDEEKISGIAERISIEADFLILLVLNENPNLTKALLSVFKKGYWDIPYCLHPDNKKAVRSFIDECGFVSWLNKGKIPFPHQVADNLDNINRSVSASEFLQMLSFNQYQYDKTSLRRPVKIW